MKIVRSCLSGLDLIKNCLFKIGDKFMFNLELMEENNIGLCGDGDKIHEVFDIGYYKDLGYLITFEPGGCEFAAQINAVWCKRIY